MPLGYFHVPIVFSALHRRDPTAQWPSCTAWVIRSEGFVLHSLMYLYFGPYFNISSIAG